MKTLKELQQQHKNRFIAEIRKMALENNVILDYYDVIEEYSQLMLNSDGGYEASYKAKTQDDSASEIIMEVVFSENMDVEDVYPRDGHYFEDEDLAQNDTKINEENKKMDDFEMFIENLEGKEIMLMQLSDILIFFYEFEDMFSFDIERDILDLENKRGSFADIKGDKIVEFDIVKIGEHENNGRLTHLDTLVKIKNKENKMKLYEIQLSDGTIEGRALKENEKIVKSFYSEDLQYLTSDTVNKYNLKAGMEKSDIENWEEIKEEARFADNYFGISYMIDIDKLDENALFFDDSTNELYDINVVKEWEVKEYIYSNASGSMHEILDIIEL